MTQRTGSADLPLHGGRVPQWLALRMSVLGRLIVETIAVHYGRDEVLRRLAHPFWFQSFGAVMGMDWHSSGITTSVLGALKRGLAPLQRELGLYVCGGRGRHSRRTPEELLRVGDRTGLDGDALGCTSRLVAKIDSAAVQDGYALYLHGFIVSASGEWCVVQQGMSEARREARRYHWLSEGLQSFLDSPHQAIEGPNAGTIVNLADARAARARAASLALLAHGPDRIIGTLRAQRAQGSPSVHARAALSLFPELDAPFMPGAGTAAGSGKAAPAKRMNRLPHLQLPAHHDVRASDVVLRRLHATLAAATERAPKDYSELLLTSGVGARTVAALAFVAEIVHGTPSRFTDPARFSLAHGGKDGHPFPVPLKVYDETIRVLKAAIGSARLGNDERLAALRRLDSQSRALERVVRGESFEAHIARERAAAAAYGGRVAAD